MRNDTYTEGGVSTPTAEKFAPSPYQAAIFDFVETGEGNAIIEAVAGSGKTTTIVQALRKTSGRAIFLAFNKTIAEELKLRVPPHVQARTFHSLCYRPVLDALHGAKTINQNKLRDLVRTTFGKRDNKLYGMFAMKLVGLARQSGLGAIDEATPEAFRHLVDHHDLTLEYDDADEHRGIELALALLAASNASREADFDDLLYFAVLKGIRLPAFDWVFVDEAQDTNAIQRALLRKILAQGGRFVAVGDPAQAIYGFRGADSDALDLIAETFSPCARLPLSATYRCATSIVDRAREFVSAIEPRAGAPVGVVEDLDLDWKLTDLGEHDLVVCRYVRPLVDLGYRCLRARKPVRILGRDIGEGLKSLIKKCDLSGDVDELIARVEAWRNREAEKAIAKGLEAKAEAITDKAEAVLVPRRRAAGGGPDRDEAAGDGRRPVYRRELADDAVDDSQGEGAGGGRRLVAERVRLPVALGEEAVAEAAGTQSDVRRDHPREDAARDDRVTEALITK